MPSLVTTIIAIISLASISVLTYYLAKRSRAYFHLYEKWRKAEIQLEKELENQQHLVAEIAELKDKVKHNVLNDSVTGLPSRQVFEDRLIQTINQSKRNQLTFAVLVLDVDQFRMINDALGHDVGDELLREIAKRLEPCIRQVDTLSHFMGDEFVFILTQLSKAETAAYVARRLLHAISQPFHLTEHQLFITASIGIAVYPVDGDDGKILMKNADNALHQAKSRGRNMYQFYHEEMFALSRRELILSSSLCHDLVFQELKIYYQPQVDVTSRKIIAVEALLRWQHPDFGLIAPQELLRFADNNGRLIAIGEWVLRTACEQFIKWQAAGFNLNSISVNVSLRQLENSHFVYKLSQILKETGMQPESITIEISETVLLDKFEIIEKSLHMLKHLGVQIAIDDFGTGRLSLQHLKRFPVDSLKVDTSLIHDITVNKDSEAIVKMVSALADTLKLKLVAVGVETQNQKQLLQSMGFHIMQGYMFSPPILPQELNEFAINSITEKVSG